MRTVRQFIVWSRWKSRIRWRQLWGNVKIFNIGNGRNFWYVLVFGRGFGIVFMFMLGFGIAFICSKIGLSQDFAWAAVFVMPLIDGIADGTKVGGALSAAGEEKWLLGVTNISKTKYLLFLWMDRFIWNTGNRILASISIVFGVDVLYRLNLIHVFAAYSLSFLAGVLLSLLMTMAWYIRANSEVTNFPLQVFVRLLASGLLCFIAVEAGLYISRHLLLLARMGYFKFAMHVAIQIPKHIMLTKLVWLLPVALADLLVHGLFPLGLFVVPLYFMIFIAAAIVLIRAASKVDQSPYDHSPNSSVRKILHVLSARVSFPIGRHIPRGYFVAMVRSASAKSYFVSLASSFLWPLTILCVIVSLALPTMLSVQIVPMVLLSCLLFLCTLTVRSAFRLLGSRLSFDAEGGMTQYLLLHGMDAKRLYDMKMTAFRLLSWPVLISMTLIYLLPLQLSTGLKTDFFLVAALYFWLQSEFVLLPSLLTPHFERATWATAFFDQRVLGQAVRRMVNLPLSISITLVVYDIGMRSPLNSHVMLLVVVASGIPIYFMLRMLKRMRLASFSEEEIFLSREVIMGSGFWKGQMGVVSSAIVVLLAVSVFLLTRQYVLGLGSFLLLRALISLFILNSYRRSVIALDHVSLSS